MYFCSKEVEKDLQIYRMKYSHGKLHIEHDGKTVSFATDSISEEHKDLLQKAIKAFLCSNPSGFGKITHTLLEAFNDCLHLSYYPDKSLLTLIEQIAHRLTYTLLDPSPISYPFRDFTQMTEFPFLYIPSPSLYSTEWISSCNIAPGECWIIEMTPEKLIKVTTGKNGWVHTCTPAPERGERLLTPRIFMNAMRRFVELDTKNFVRTFNILKEHYDTLPPACNMHYYQLCFMADIYAHFKDDMIQVSHFCPWIDYD